MKTASILFSDPGVRKPAGIPSFGWALHMIVTLFLIRESLCATLLWDFNRMRKLIGEATLFLWALEFVKIRYRRSTESIASYDTWIPLYFCSISLYAGLLSGFGTLSLKHAGDVFLATGGLCAGVCFLLYPSTSLLIYPGIHFISLHSFLYHGFMIYVGILVNRSGLVVLEWRDFPIYCLFVLFFCILADRMNRRKGCNLMFIERPMEDTLLVVAKRIVGKYYKVSIILAQMVLPFVSILVIRDCSGLLSRPIWYDSLMP